MATALHKTGFPSGNFLFSWLFSGLYRRPPRRRAYLDPRELSPYLQRDLGLLDGNEPYRRRP
jgi:hypothetical protein